jgi:hypothetical protein
MMTPTDPPARWQDMPVRKRYPVAPKTQAAGYGAGTGALISALVVSLVQTYWTHKALPAATVQAIYAIVPIVLAFTAAYFAPHQPRPTDPGEVHAQYAAALEQHAAALDEYRATLASSAITDEQADAALGAALQRRFGRPGGAVLGDQPAPSSGPGGIVMTGGATAPPVSSPPPPVTPTPGTPPA